MKFRYAAFVALFSIFSSSAFSQQNFQTPFPQTQSLSFFDALKKVLVQGINTSPVINYIPEQYPKASWGKFGMMANDTIRGSKNTRHKTNSPGFNNIPGVATQFYAEENNTEVAIHFSANTFLSTPQTVMKVRAVVDGVATPSVRFVSGNNNGATAYVFQTRVQEGAHDVVMQFAAVNGGEAQVANASILIQHGTPNSNISRIKTANYTEDFFNNSIQWVNLDQPLQISTQPSERLQITFSAEAWVNAQQGLYLRALVDGAAHHPTEVLLTGQVDTAARTVTFVTDILPQGNHSIQMQLKNIVGNGGLGNRSVTVVPMTYKKDIENNAFVSRGNNLFGFAENNWSEIPDMRLRMNVPSNAEIAALLNLQLFSAHAAPVYVRVRAVDDNGNEEIIAGPESRILQASNGVYGASQFAFSIKGINQSGEEKIKNIIFEWKSNNVLISIGKRSAVLRSERGTLPDLTGGIKMVSHPQPYRQSVNVLTLVASRNLIEPETYRLDGSGISMDDIEDALFGAHSMRDYYQDVSNGKLNFENAGVMGPYPAVYPALNAACEDANGGEIAWEGATDVDSCNSVCSQGYVTRGRRAWMKMIERASQDVNFASYDVNRDGIVDPTELAILIVEPHSAVDGATRNLYYCSNKVGGSDFIVDGVKLLKAASWNLDSDSGNGLASMDFSTAAHELSHQVFNTTDLYSGGVAHNFEALFTSLMAYNGGKTAYFDALHRLAFAWIRPQLVSESGIYTVDAANAGGGALILPRLDGKSTEFFIIENRNSAAANSVGIYDQEIKDSGLAIWHFIDGYGLNSVSLRDQLPACYTPEDWAKVSKDARRSIRLIRPGVVSWSSNSLFKQGDPELLDQLGAGVDGCGDRSNAVFGTPSLKWADGTSSGYSLSFPLPAGVSMTVDIKIDRSKN